MRSTSAHPAGLKANSSFKIVIELKCGDSNNKNRLLIVLFKEI